MIRLLQILLVSCCCFTALAHAAGPVQALEVRAMSEDWGDELAAQGNARGAFDQYTAIWRSWHNISRLHAMRGQVSQEAQGNLERLTTKVAATLKKLRPPPVVPDGSVFAAQKGRTFFKLAKDVRDFNAAGEQFELALSSAPWVSDFYFNLAVCQKSAGQLAAALRTVRLAAILVTDKKENQDILGFRAELEAMIEIENRRR